MAGSADIDHENVPIYEVVVLRIVDRLSWAQPFWDS